VFLKINFKWALDDTSKGKLNVTTGDMSVHIQLNISDHYDFKVLDYCVHSQASMCFLNPQNLFLIRMALQCLLHKLSTINLDNLNPTVVNITSSPSFETRGLILVWHVSLERNSLLCV